ncbi:hypothetical protein BC827DRAFT_1196845 [Russula dissimulans]|nr:hypothetical protein BC827DRAFT_1196845 [Russula dissimulans]
MTSFSPDSGCPCPTLPHSAVTHFERGGVYTQSGVSLLSGSRLFLSLACAVRLPQYFGRRMSSPHFREAAPDPVSLFDPFLSVVLHATWVLAYLRVLSLVPYCVAVQRRSGQWSCCLHRCYCQRFADGSIRNAEASSIRKIRGGNASFFNRTH